MYRVYQCTGSASTRSRVYPVYLCSRSASAPGLVCTRSTRVPGALVYPVIQCIRSTRVVGLLVYPVSCVPGPLVYPVSSVPPLGKFSKCHFFCVFDIKGKSQFGSIEPSINKVQVFFHPPPPPPTFLVSRIQPSLPLVIEYSKPSLFYSL